MGNNDATFTIGADPTGLLAGLSKAQSAMEAATAKMSASLKPLETGFKGVGDSLDKFHSKISKAFEFVGAAAAIEGLRKIGEMLNESAERAEKFKQLSQIVGTTTTEFQGLAATAESVGVGQETLQRGLLKLSERMTMARDGSQQAKDQLAKVGITAADLASPAFTAANALYTVAKSGAAAGDIQLLLGQRSTMLMAAFDKLRGGQSAMEEEARRVNALNASEIETLERYRERVAVMGTEYDNLKGHVAAYLISASSPLIQSFRNLGHSMSGTIDLTVPLKAAFATLESVIVLLINQFTALAGIITNTVRGAVDSFMGLGTVMKDVFTGNWSALKTDARDAFNVVKDDGAAAFNAYADDVKNSISGVHDAWVAAFKQPAAGPAEDEQRTQTGGGGTGGTSRGDGGVAALRRVVADKRKLIREELSDIDKTMAEEVSIWKTGYEAEYDAQLAALDRQLAAVKEAAKQRALTPQQEFQAERQLLQERLQAQMAYFEKLKGLEQGNAVQIAKINAEEQKAQAKYLQAVDQAHQQTTQQIFQSWNRLGNTMGNMWAGMIDRMLAGTMNFHQMLQATFRQIAMNFIKMETQTLSHYITTEAAKAEAARASAAIQGEASADAASQGLSASGGFAVTKILNDAYQAASGAYQATVGIPYVGPLLAPLAATAAFAAVSAFGGNIASASGGYDIPAGVNPITQLHAREMVLPAHLADVVRGGGANGATHHHHYNINAIDQRSFIESLTNGGSASVLATSIQALHTRFAL